MNNKQIVELAMIEIAGIMSRIDLTELDSNPTALDTLNGQLNRMIDLAARARYRIGLIQDQR